MKKIMHGVYSVYVFFYVIGVFLYIVPGALYSIAKEYPALKADEFRKKRLKYYE